MRHRDVTNPKVSGTTVKEPRAPRGPAHPPVPRLEAMGATPAVIAEIYDRWQGLSDEERRGAVADIAALDDDELRALLAEQAAGPPVEGTVDDVMAWVGDDARRAQSALEAEEARPKPRTTLMARLEQIANG